MTKTKSRMCRVCSCTEDRACAGGCSWVRVEKNSPPLCSGCDGTDGDMDEALNRIAWLARRDRGGKNELREIGQIARAARKRFSIMGELR